MNAKGFVTICGYGPNLENAPADKDATVVERYIDFTRKIYQLTS
jgi:hypothetical protein